MLPKLALEWSSGWERHKVLEQPSLMPLWNCRNGPVKEVKDARKHNKDIVNVAFDKTSSHVKNVFVKTPLKNQYNQYAREAEHSLEDKRKQKSLGTAQSMGTDNNNKLYFMY